ncbi:ShlB/FhaC/HecB family hemolysin secretion/activation protein [Dyella telluris]|uniref:ShlB/FhaC/HecB family hemolysin secretion/activation protein n=1 Tax=Dyella telluris TaxID=2763498 RepID=A0A7G8Q3U9_9GAMM|nr:ShlB/FhaC/HecB family hemolysin secretion/activation protein [Dyella telluris]QNK01457.1 ShlB/FhaC/HecB family hemolysin secretion/activation protein [Dyella telluris]
MACLAAALALAVGSGQLYAQDRDDATASPTSGNHSASAISATGDAHSATIVVRGFRVTGVGEHASAHITPASMQALADEQYTRLTGAAGQPRLSVAQMNEVAGVITQRYRKSGFIVAQAVVPAQSVGPDQVVEIRVLEGTIGKVVVQGASHYSARIIAAPAEHLKGQSLQKDDVDTALLYARDLPGVAITSTFQPGEHTGETDLIMVAQEDKRPYVFTLGGNNYGTDVTGRYHAQAGLTWNSPLGYGDVFNANFDYAFAPAQSLFGSLSYRAPILPVSGLTAVFGGTRSQLEVDSGVFASLHVHGPTSTWYGGADWKFINTPNLQALGTFRLIREESKLNSSVMLMSDERFDVAELGFSMNHTDTRFHGVDLLQVAVRQSISNRSPSQVDLVSPGHDDSFTVAKLAYTRLQFLTPTQRLYFKFSGQYTDDALTPMEQFVIGGPDNVRAYPIADVLADRGYYTSVEYHVDAPGFADAVSPFHARPWRELLELETFVDYARGWPVGGNRLNGVTSKEVSDIGAGFVFRLPRFHRFELHVDAAKALSSLNASDGKGYHVYARFGFTF